MPAAPTSHAAIVGSAAAPVNSETVLDSEFDPVPPGTVREDVVVERLGVSGKSGDDAYDGAAGDCSDGDTLGT